MGIISAVIVNCVGGAALYLTGGLAMSVVGPWLGFSSSGIVAGSLAASAQSFYGNLVSGSVISTMTSAAMTSPLGLVARIVIYLCLGVAGAAIWVVKKLNHTDYESLKKRIEDDGFFTNEQSKI